VFGKGLPVLPNTCTPQCALSNPMCAFHAKERYEISLLRKVSMERKEPQDRVQVFQLRVGRHSAAPPFILYVVPKTTRYSAARHEAAQVAVAGWS
jgi:hypothetical protein